MQSKFHREQTTKPFTQEQRKALLWGSHGLFGYCLPPALCVVCPGRGWESSSDFPYADRCCLNHFKNQQCNGEILFLCREGLRAPCGIH